MEEALSLIEYAIAQTEEELLYQRWINGLQYQMSFDDFKHQLQPAKPKKTQEILDDVKEMMKLYNFSEGR